jgi:hypothetical protein
VFGLQSRRPRAERWRSQPRSWSCSLRICNSVASPVPKPRHSSSPRRMEVRFATRTGATACGCLPVGQPELTDSASTRCGAPPLQRSCSKASI